MYTDLGHRLFLFEIRALLIMKVITRASLFDLNSLLPS